MSWPIVITLAAVGSAAVATFLWLWWWVPKWQMRSITAADPKARADIEDNFRKTIGQMIGGTMVLVGAGVGAVIAYLQLSQQQQASHELLISNQVSKGFEQLDSGKLVVRLGGIYALEGVMNTSEQYHQPVLEALSAFVRNGTRTETGDGPPAADIQAALTVIVRRAAIGTGVPDLVNAHIPKAYLRGRVFRFNPVDGSDLRGDDQSKLDELQGANLRNVNLRGADMTQVNLRGADLSDANLSGAILDAVDLRRAMLNGTNLRGAYLMFHTNLSGDILGRVNLRGAFLVSANLSGALLSESDLSGAYLARSPRRPRHHGELLPPPRRFNLMGPDANLSGAQLSDVDLSGSNVLQSQLDKACGTQVKLDPGLTIKLCP
jgi:uncharacterized protein YjbI with pentapeptide repeats